VKSSEFSRVSTAALIRFSGREISYKNVLSELLGGVMRTSREGQDHGKRTDSKEECCGPMRNRIDMQLCIVALSIVHG
jgi:hypothetical protein